MKRNLILIAGIHGVGKGTIAKQVSAGTGVSCFSASDLIRERKKSPVDAKKNVIDADENQEYLITAVLEESKKHPRLLLDGHFTLWHGQSFFLIPVSVFENLPIESIILIEEPPEVVMSRLNNRDGYSKSLKQVSAALTQERNHANLVKEVLGVPMLTINSAQYEEAEQWVLNKRL